MTDYNDSKPNFEGHPNSECGEHRTVGSHRAWCFNDTEWCYPHAPCRGCELPVLRAVADAARATLDITGLNDALQKRAALRTALAALDGEGLVADA